MHTAIHSGRLLRNTSHSGRRDAFGMSKPVLAWALVLAVTFLSFYVHLLNEQMVRANGLGMAPVPMTQHVKERAEARALSRGQRAQNGQSVEQVAAAR